MSSNNDSSITKEQQSHSFLEAIDQAFDGLLPDDWSYEQSSQLSLEVDDYSAGAGLYNKIPRRCKETCPDIENRTCPLTKKPFGGRCPIEVKILSHLITNYISTLEIDQDDMVSLGLVRDLVDVEILILRKQAALSASGDLLIDEDQYSQRGEYLQTVQVENPLLAIDDRLNKRKKDILKQLAATREAQLKVSNDSTSISQMAQMAKIMAKMHNDVEKHGYSDSVREAEIIDDFLDT